MCVSWVFRSINLLVGRFSVSGIMIGRLLWVYFLIKHTFAQAPRPSDDSHYPHNHDLPRETKYDLSREAARLVAFTAIDYTNVP